MPNRHGDFIWYELLTSDAAAAKAFYDPVVGWDIEAQASMPGMDYRMIRAGSGHAGGVMVLSAEMREHGARPTWVGYVGVDDVDAAVAKAESLGGKAMMPAFDLPGVGRIAMIADPQGIPLYVMRGASDEVSTAFSPDEPGRGRRRQGHGPAADPGQSGTNSRWRIALRLRHFSMRTGWTRSAIVQGSRRIGLGCLRTRSSRAASMRRDPIAPFPVGCARPRLSRLTDRDTLYHTSCIKEPVHASRRPDRRRFHPFCLRAGGARSARGRA